MPASLATAIVFPFCEVGEQARQALPLVVLVERDERLPDPQMGEQAAGVAGVLAGDEVGRLEGGPGPRREVVEVADRGGDDQEPAGHQFLPNPAGSPGRG